MDIKIYGKIKDGLERHLKASNMPKAFIPDVKGIPPVKDGKFPLVVIDESRNVPYNNYRGRLETVASLGYKVDVFAKQIGNNTKQDIARVIAEYCNDYLTLCVGLRQVSWNIMANDGQNGDLYHIIIMYSAPYHEQRQTILR